MREYGLEGKTIEIAKWEGRTLHLYMRHGKEYILSPIPESGDIMVHKMEKQDAH